MLTQLGFLHFILLASAALAAPVENSTLDNSVETTTSFPNPTTSEDSVMEDNMTESTAVESQPDFISYKNTTTFTCYGRPTGYYADTRLNCRIYHFCTQMESIGETSYQRMSYICLEDSVFDQKDLNCVKESDLKIPCEEAEKAYESSNRQFDPSDDNEPSYSDSLAAGLMMNPITRFIAGR